jgi:hypothetical protein
MAARCATTEFREINVALSQMPAEAAPAPVSCAALLAQKMGTSDTHRVMAAGLAGGIGLSGGGCGALGTALWLVGMKRLQEGAGALDLKTPEILGTMERFGKCTHGEFECSKIVGRKFDNVDEHASYLRAGGCAKIIEELAAPISE